jgi:hypothetical protein
MKIVLVVLFSMSAALAFPKFDKKTLEQLKEKGCPLVNGKKDCTAEEIKVKALDLKNKIKF